MRVFIRSSSRRREGTATIVVLALLGIVLLFLGINAQSISNLQRELKVLDQQQTKRLHARGGVAKAEKSQLPLKETNAIPVVSGF